MQDKKCKNLQKTFEQLGLSDSTLTAIKQKGFEYPTPIQALTIPALLSGKKDLIGQAQTGTGKTAAFSLPLIEMLKEQARDVQALILTPTRELAIQVAEEIQSLKGSKKLDVLPVYGGQSIITQLKPLKRGVDIVVGTPGRVIDHLERGTLRLNRLTQLVLDEADEMLNRGFLPEIEAILKYIQQEKQTLLFSATMSPEILNIAKKYMREYEILKVEQTQIACDSIEQRYYKTTQQERFGALCRIIDSESPFYGLIFCRTKMDTERVARKLSDIGYAADALNGNMSQNAREKILDKFKRKAITILVATDVAARGIDVKNVSHVINYALPTEPEAYVHRIGRTGRAGTKGKAFSFVCPNDRGKLRLIERKIKTKIQEAILPSPEELVNLKKESMINQIKKQLEKNPQEYYLNIAKELLEDHDKETLVAMLLKQGFKKQLEKQHYSNNDEPVQKEGGRSEGRGRSRGRGSRSGGGSRGSRFGGKDRGRSSSKRGQSRDKQGNYSKRKKRK